MTQGARISLHACALRTDSKNFQLSVVAKKLNVTTSQIFWWYDVPLFRVALPNFATNVVEKVLEHFQTHPYF